MPTNNQEIGSALVDCANCAKAFMQKRAKALGYKRLYDVPFGEERNLFNAVEKLDELWADDDK